MAEIKAISESINSKLATMHTSASGGLPDDMDFPYLVFEIQGDLYALNCKYIVSIEETGSSTEIVNAASEVRGISYYKNEAMNMYDLRTIFGYMSQLAYIEEEINIPSHLDSHESLTMRLESYINGGPVFNDSPNPALCPFGKWFDSYKPSNVEIRSHLNKIGPVHEKIHRLAAEAVNCVKSERTDSAQEIADEIRETHMVEFTEKMQKLYSVLKSNVREITVVLRNDLKKLGLVVDNVDSVDNLTEIQYLPPMARVSSYVEKIGLRNRDKKIILIVEPLSFFS